MSGAGVVFSVKLDMDWLPIFLVTLQNCISNPDECTSLADSSKSWIWRVPMHYTHKCFCEIPEFVIREFKHFSFVRFDTDNLQYVDCPTTFGPFLVETDCESVYGTVLKT